MCSAAQRLVPDHLARAQVDDWLVQRVNGFARDHRFQQLGSADDTVEKVVRHELRLLNGSCRFATCFLDGRKTEAELLVGHLNDVAISQELFDGPSSIHECAVCTGEILDGVPIADPTDGGMFFGDHRGIHPMINGFGSADNEWQP